MARRIIGQCGQSDFDSIEHLVGLVDRAEDLDLSTLTSGQQYAIRFAAAAFNKGISWQLMRDVVRQVLFWDEEGKRKFVEIKFKKDRSTKASQLRAEFNKLWRI